VRVVVTNTLTRTSGLSGFLSAYSRARKGIFITTSQFSRGAVDYASSIDSKIILIDGQRLVEFMIDHGVGVTTEATYELKRMDSDYFSEE